MNRQVHRLVFSASRGGFMAVGETARSAGKRCGSVRAQRRSNRPIVNQNTDRWGNVLSISDPRSANWVTSYSY
ncbi:ESPR-type extended signal peptide-containing protein, partial [Variovorax paradoxus]|uniref:ESPR-type extended signal peptide-containing protein n=1 Tax=Variovorax paradoxus TaxID=34073 RepID=UPI002782A5F5